MIEFKKSNDKVILSYSSDRSSPEWVYHELDKLDIVRISTAFLFTKNELLTTFDQSDEYKPVEFQVAEKQDEYFCFPKDILSIEHDLYIHENIVLERKLFIAERGISIFGKVDNLVSQSIYIGGNKDDAIPEATLRELLKSFPNTYELNRYAEQHVFLVFCLLISKQKMITKKSISNI